MEMGEVKKEKGAFEKIENKYLLPLFGKKEK